MQVTRDLLPRGSASEWFGSHFGGRRRLASPQARI